MHELKTITGCDCFEQSKLVESEFDWSKRKGMELCMGGVSKFGHPTTTSEHI